MNGKVTVLALAGVVSAATVAYTVARKPELAQVAYGKVKDRVTDPDGVVSTGRAKLAARVPRLGGRPAASSPRSGVQPSPTEVLG
jgi:hypothetical protein